MADGAKGKEFSEKAREVTKGWEHEAGEVKQKYEDVKAKKEQLKEATDKFEKSPSDPEIAEKYKAARKDYADSLKDLRSVTKEREQQLQKLMDEFADNQKPPLPHIKVKVREEI